MMEQEKFNQKAWALIEKISKNLWLLIKVFFIGIPILLFLAYAVADNIYALFYHPIIYVIALVPSFTVLMLSILTLFVIGNIVKFIFPQKFKDKDIF